MLRTKLTTTLRMMALAAPAAWAGQFGDYEPHGFLSDYTKQAMDYWAQLIRERLDAAHGK